MELDQVVDYCNVCGEYIVASLSREELTNPKTAMGHVIGRRTSGEGLEWRRPVIVRWRIGIEE